MVNNKQVSRNLVCLVSAWKSEYRLLHSESDESLMELVMHHSS